MTIHVESVVEDLNRANDCTTRASVPGRFVLVIRIGTGFFSLLPLFRPPLSLARREGGIHGNVGDGSDGIGVLTFGIAGKPAWYSGYSTVRKSTASSVDTTTCFTVRTVLRCRAVDCLRSTMLKR